MAGALAGGASVPGNDARCPVCVWRGLRRMTCQLSADDLCINEARNRKHLLCSGMRACYAEHENGIDKFGATCAYTIIFRQKRKQGRLERRKL